ncbi:MAG: hypothetical protein LCI00_31940 [Chloroflexi bacterium]|nr:hypothetical protein [Chloroflexota bacterium]MCC6891993.1 hypothetical protein [Anaerolineae bacterium]
MEKKKKKGTPLPDDLFIVYPQNEYLLARNSYGKILTFIGSIVGLVVIYVFGLVINRDDRVTLVSLFAAVIIIVLIFKTLIELAIYQDTRGKRRIIGQVIECKGRIEHEMSSKKGQNITVEVFYLTLIIEFSPKHDHPLRTEIDVKRDDLRFTALPRNRPVAIYYRNEQDFTVV